MKPTVIVRNPWGPPIIIRDIQAVRWRREDRTDTAKHDVSVYVFEGADGNKTAEIPAEAVLAIVFDGPEHDKEDAREGIPYTAHDLLIALLHWYDEEFGPDPEDVAGALVAIVPLYYAAGVLLSLDKEDARIWVRDALRNVHAEKNP